MKIAVLDAGTLGDDINVSERFGELGETVVYASTASEQTAERVSDADVVVVNKVKLGRDNLENARKLKLICVAATGYDNIDIEYCRAHGISVCNVIGYSTDSVAQTTVATVLELTTHIRVFSEYVKNGSYTDSGVANKVTPVYRELAGKTWGIVGLGNIGKKVAAIANAFGCKVIANKRTPEAGYECVDLETICRESDIISVHTPLTPETRGLIGENEIAKMKDGVILYNAARGAVTDEDAVANAVKSGKIGALGCDVYSFEPMSKTHPYFEIKGYDNVCLTPHMAWGSYEARNRCVDEMVENIKAFYSGNKRNALC